VLDRLGPIQPAPDPLAPIRPMVRESFDKLDWAESCGVSRYLLRFSVGLVSPDVLIDRLEQTLAPQQQAAEESWFRWFLASCWGITYQLKYRAWMFAHSLPVHSFQTHTVRSVATTVQRHFARATGIRSGWTANEWKEAALMSKSACTVLCQAASSRPGEFDSTLVERAATTFGRMSGSELFSPQAWQRIARLLSLSERELQVVQGVFDDFKDRRIASRIGISQHTVHTHFERLYLKLDVHNRTGLMLRIFATYLTVSDDGHCRT
jgi:DNA-binding CsgD family transcriptional regulator